MPSLFAHPECTAAPHSARAMRVAGAKRPAPEWRAAPPNPPPARKNGCMPCGIRILGARGLLMLLGLALISA